MQDINPYVRFAKYDTLKPHHVIRERVIYDYEIVCIMQGTVTITIEDRAIEGKTGDLFFFKPGQRHSFTVHEAPLVQPHVHFDLVYTDNSPQKPVNHKPCSEMTENERSIVSKDISNLFFQHFPSYIHLRNPMVMEQYLFEVIRAYQNPGPFPEIQTKACFLKLWLQLLNEVQWLQTEYCNMKVERAEAYKIYLEQNFNRRIMMADLESTFHITRSYISRTYKEIYGISPIHYHVAYRISLAKDMLKFTNLPIQEISNHLGFLNQQDFSRTYHRIEGERPRDCRQINEKE